MKHQAINNNSGHFNPRTLLKQGPYGNVPILKRVLIVTPSSLMKVCHETCNDSHFITDILPYASRWYISELDEGVSQLAGT